MKISNAEHNALSMFIKVLMDKRSHRDKERKEPEHFSTVRHDAAKEYKKRFVEHALRCAGIDLQDLELQDLFQRQAHDTKTVTTFLDMQKQRLLAQASNINKDHSVAIAERVSHWNQVSARDSMLSQQSIPITLDTAALIQISGEGSSNIAPNNNVVFTKASIDSGGDLGGPLRGKLVNVDWLFVFTPPKTGFLNATSLLSMNGSSALWTNSTCDGGSSSAYVNASMTLSQGNAKDSSVTNICDAGVHTSWGESLGAVNVVGLSEIDTVAYRPTQFPVIADIPIIISVTASLYVLVQNGHGELDVMSGEFRLNVPLVFITLVF
jgi:hypothetical protein